MSAATQTQAFVLLLDGYTVPGPRRCNIIAVDTHRTMNNRLEIAWQTRAACPAPPLPAPTSTQYALMATAEPMPRVLVPTMCAGGHSMATAVGLGAFDTGTGQPQACLPLPGAVLALAQGAQGVWVATQDGAASPLVSLLVGNTTVKTFSYSRPVVGFAAGYVVGPSLGSVGTACCT